MVARVGTGVGTGDITTSESATYGVELGDDWDLGRVYDLAPGPSIIVVVNGLVLPPVGVYTICVGVSRVAVFALLFGIGWVGTDTGGVAILTSGECEVL